MFTDACQCRQCGFEQDNTAAIAFAIQPRVDDQGAEIVWCSHAESSLAIDHSGRLYCRDCRVILTEPVR